MSSEVLAGLVRKMKDLGDIKNDLEDQLKEVNKQWDLVRKVEIPEAMAAIDPGLKSLKIAGLGTVYLRADLYSGVVDKERAYQWLTDNGFQDLIQPQVFPSTLKAWMREQLEEGTDLPDCFKVDPYVFAVITK